MKVLYVIEIRTDKVMPDILIIDKAKCTTTVIDVAALLDWNVKDKNEKILKYHDLRIEILKLCNIRASYTIVGTLGATSTNFDKYLRKIAGKRNSTALLKSALISHAVCEMSKQSGILSRSMQDKGLQLTTAVIK